MLHSIRTHYRTCNLCEAMCGLEITLEGDDILSIRGDKNDPFSKGHICPKAVALQDIYYDKDRLKHPVRRTKSGWEQIGWDEAFDTVVSNLKAIQKKYGRNAVGVYLGNPNVHNSGSLLFGPPSQNLAYQESFLSNICRPVASSFCGLFYVWTPAVDTDPRC